MNEWISVRERMPDMYINADGCWCTKRTNLVCNAGEKTVHLCYCIREIKELSDGVITNLDRWYDQTGDRIEDVTHWIEIPELPKW